MKLYVVVGKDRHVYDAVLIYLDKKEAIEEGKAFISAHIKNGKRMVVQEPNSHWSWWAISSYEDGPGAFVHEIDVPGIRRR